MENETAFKLSRVYAQGWNMARKISQTGNDPAQADAGRLNPYSTDPEQARWMEGFSGASGGNKSR